ncbi:MAG TPA: AMP-binding protein, partial [Polyangiaceae bacterium]|nr:AMP-binding protein [Polyangiaceae bacterium]
MADSRNDLTVASAVERSARANGQRIAYTFVRDAQPEAEHITYAELDARAAALALRLNRQGLAAQPVLVMCPAGFDYAVALLACWRAGAIAVPAYPPTRTNAARAVPRLRAIVADARARVALTTSDVRNVAMGFDLGGLELTVVDGETGVSDGTEAGVYGDPDSAAILQYTSGSTSTPKGVLLTHAQLVANQQMSCASSNITGDDVFVSWLPPYHDMGLMGGVVLPLFTGGRGVLMTPDAFIRKPLRWLTTIAEHRASVLMAPN